jgi:uncharacterized protein (UPF0210 family)
MTAVCSVGLDIDRGSRRYSPEIISAIIADEAPSGMINSKTTAVRLIPPSENAKGKNWNSEASRQGAVMKINRNPPLADQPRRKIPARCKAEKLN